MRKHLLPLLFCFCAPLAARAQVREFVSLNTRQIESLDRSKAVVIVPGGILEEHGPYLPAGSDGIFNQRLANDLAAFVASKPGWIVLMLPSVPLGAGAANEMGAKYSFPGSCTVLPNTLRSIFMDLADQLGRQRFRWILIVHGHGDPVHNQMLDQASEYFHDTYGGEMVHVFGYVWAANKDLRTPEEQKKDGQPEHATMTETSVILALKPEWVASDYKTAKPYAGPNIDELERIAKENEWPGYFGDPALANASLGTKIYEQWLAQAKDLVTQVLTGKDYRKMPRYGDLTSGDPADIAAAKENARLETQHAAWLQKHPLKTSH
jgi:creatinine amidohydrolase